MQSKKKILIIGNNSYLASGLSENLNDFDVFTLNIPDFIKDADLIKSVDTIINFSIQPEFSTREIEENEIIDLKIAKLIKNTSAKFFFISSRKIYGQYPELKIFKETDEPSPIDFYAQNKLLAEKLLQKELGERLCILRIANIIGEPILRQGYNTFMGWITREFVKKGKLRITENPTTVKDFVTKDYLHKILVEFFKKEESGMFNIGSGIDISIGELLGNIVGKENLIIEGEHPIREQFLLNNNKLQNILPLLTKKELLDDCKNYNKMLSEMKNKTVKVSVLIPAYNRPDFLKKALDSTLEQSFQNFEIIITDDSTNDECQKLLKNYNDSRIKYFHNQSPLGSPKNWNFAISQASGEYIKFLHHDDWFINEKSLEFFVKILDENPYSDFAFSQSVDINKATLEKRFHDFSEKIENIEKDIFYLFPNNVIGAPSAMIYRNKHNLLFDEKTKWVVDIEFYLQILLKNKKFIYIPEVLVAIGISDEQITNQCISNKEIECFEWDYLYKKYEDKIPNKKPQKKFLKKISKKYNRHPIHVFFDNQFRSLMKKIKPLLVSKGFSK